MYPFSIYGSSDDEERPSSRELPDTEIGSIGSVSSILLVTGFWIDVVEEVDWETE